MTRPVLLRNGVAVEDPLTVLLGFVDAPWLRFDDPSGPATFRELELRRANRDGARISAAEIEAILERRGAIERALRSIPRDASLAGAAASVPWSPLRQLFDAFADLRGVGLSKATKALYVKRPALIPILDSVVQTYLVDDDPGARAAFGDRALALVRGYKRDLDRNRGIVGGVRRELAKRGCPLTDVRILDLLIWSSRRS